MGSVMLLRTWFQDHRRGTWFCPGSWNVGSLQDSFVGELVGTIQMEAEMKGYYVMLIGGENIENVVDIASRWNVEGLIILGYNDEKYREIVQKAE